MASISPWGKVKSFTVPYTMRNLRYMSRLFWKGKRKRKRLEKTQAQFPGPLWQLTTVCNSSIRDLAPLLTSAGPLWTYIHSSLHTYAYNKTNTYFKYVEKLN